MTTEEKATKFDKMKPLMVELKNARQLYECCTRTNHPRAMEARALNSILKLCHEIEKEYEKRGE